MSERLERGPGSGDRGRQMTNGSDEVIMASGEDSMTDETNGLDTAAAETVDASRGGPPAPALVDAEAPLFDEQITRRAALKFFGTAAAASAVGITGIAGTAQALTTLGHPHHPAAATEPAAAAPGTLFFTAHELATVRVLANYVIPKDERSGSATDAKAPEFMDLMLADKETSEGAKVAMRGGLAWIDQESRNRFGKNFIAATDAQRRQILDDIAWPKKARPELSQGVSFFNRFRDATASAFFSSSMGWQDLRYMGNVFNPNWNGCPQPALDKLGVSYDVMKTRVPVGK